MGSDKINMASVTTTPSSSWKTSYSINIADIDTQHQRLVDLIDELNAAMKLGRGRDVIGQVLSRVLAYTRLHFEFDTPAWPTSIATFGPPGY